MKLSKLLQLVYGIVAYLLFLGTLLYVIGFVNSWFVPRNINSGIFGKGFSDHAINAVLLLLFAVQHTIMARPAFKNAITQAIPKAIERSTFVLASSLVLILLAIQWRAFPQILWQVENDSLKNLIQIVAACGYAMAVYATFSIDHFGLFGLKQVWADFRGAKPEAPSFKTTWLYQQVRNPLMLGFLIGFWLTPTMTVGHLIFNVLVTGYIIIGVRFFEEKDIEAQLGEAYRQYKQNTPMLIPRLKFPASVSRASEQG